jgi:hypothetical protein
MEVCRRDWKNCVKFAARSLLAAPSFVGLVSKVLRIPAPGTYPHAQRREPAQSGFFARGRTLAALSASRWQNHSRPALVDGMVSKPLTMIKGTLPGPVFFDMPTR